MPNFTCDLTSSTAPLSHFWEHTVGSCHATMALRADWQQQIKRCHDELGFKHVRFHGILSDDMGTLMCEMDQLVYSFFNADQICDFLLSIGMRPFIELSFMPSTLSSGSNTVFHYKANITPPRDSAAWAALITKLVSHWMERYGENEVAEWFFEVWNEPNLDAFWTGNRDDYFRLYKATVEALKNVNPKFKVGGPATAMNAWVPEFLNYCESNKLPVDFISTHHYPTDAFGKPGDDTLAQLAQSRRSVLREQTAATHDNARGKPVYYTEWSSSSNPFDDLHDQAYAASFIVKTVLENQGLVEGYSYWTFSDIFEENYFSSQPFHGGFGLLNIYGIPKPSYRAYELLHHLGTEIFKVSEVHDTVDIWITREKNKIKILSTNWQLPTHPVKDEDVILTFKNLPHSKKCYIERVDDEHANAPVMWIKMGKPESLSPENVKKLEQASELVKEDIQLQPSPNNPAGIQELRFRIPPQGIVCVTIET